MKKIFTLALATVLCVGSLSAQTLTFLGGTSEETPQLMGLGLSPDGKYVCGSADYGYGYFVADIQNNVLASGYTMDENEGSELRHVDNNGLAVGYDGPGITFSISGVRTELVNPAPDKYKYVLGEGLSADGSVLVGSLIGAGYATFAAISVDGGEWKPLPTPTDELFEAFTDGTGECAAKYVSGDGKVILGYIGNWGPATAWILNESGEYEVLPLYEKLVAMTDEDMESGEKPYAGLMPMNISSNGKYLLMSGVTLDGDPIPVVYDTETGEVRQYDFKDDDGQGLRPSAIADDGTMLAMTGSLMFSVTCNYIIPAGETEPISFYEWLPEYAELFMIPDMMGANIATAISADGNRIIGYLYYSDDYYDEEVEPYFRTYVIDRNATPDGIASPGTDVNAVPTTYYTIDGKRLASPQQGLNIVRLSDGTVRKVMIK